MLRTLLISVLFATAAAGCYSEEPDVAYAGGDGYAAPGLVEVSPGVQVIAGYDYPVFYSDGYYWRYDGGIWYQSGYYNRGWGVAYNVPYGVRGIRNPGAYSHWNGGVRDHRTYGGGYARGGYARGGYVGGGIRDHRVGGGAVARPSARVGGGGGARGGFHGGGHGGGHGHR